MTHSPTPGTTPRFTTLTAAAVTAALVAGAAGAANRPGENIRAYKPVADAYVSSSRPLANFGEAMLLRVDGAPETTSYLRFRVNKVKTEIESATLLLRAKGAAKVRFGVRLVRDDAWREQRLTFANAPSPSLRYAASRPVRVGAWNAVDVTPFVDADGGLVSLALTTSAARGLAFWSRESPRGPRLVIRTEDDEKPDEQMLRAIMERIEH